jgi:hypothetical protein
MAMSTVVGASSALERCIKIDASDDGMFIPRPTITLKVERYFLAAVSCS